MSIALRGLYAITSESLCRDTRHFDARIAGALRGGANLLQYRDKWNDAATRTALARRALALCHSHGARLIVNDELALAQRIGADGVHLGASDGSIAEARAQLGPQAIIGATCGNSLQRAAAAAQAGASYLAFGAFFPSRTKPEALPADPETLRGARAFALPLCAIGGITPDNGTALLRAGADLLAAVGGVFDTADSETAARAYARLFGT